VDMKEYIKAYPEEPGLAPLSEAEVRRLYQEIHRFSEHVAPYIREYIDWAFPALIHCLRKVKKEVKEEFKGSEARGSELTIQLGIPRFFTKAGTTMTDWLFTIAAVGEDWFISGSADAAIEVPETEGFVFAAWADPIDSPKVDSVQLEKGGDLIIPERLNFELCEKYPIIRLKKPWVIEPKDKYRIKVYYFATGDDKLQPLAFRICKAEDVLPSL